MDITLNELNNRIKKAYNLMSPCTLCPRMCKVNRKDGEKGVCLASDKMKVAHAFPHFGEEPPISGKNGSGTIFFSNCNLRCVYCQNYPFSHKDEGKEISSLELAEKMLMLQEQGCHNINLVTPTHFLPLILESLYEAKKAGLSIPVVYNTSGYERIETVKLLKDIVDIYLVDMRYINSESAQKYSSAPDYPLINQTAILEMFNQTGEPQISENDLMQKGVIIRHLVLPNHLDDSKNIFNFISSNFSGKIPVSLMSQYYPYHRASEFIELNRKITKQEYNKALELMDKYNLNNGWIQEFSEEEDKNFAGVYFK